MDNALAGETAATGVWGGDRAKFQALRRMRAERHGLSELRRGRTLMSTTFLPSRSAIGRAFGRHGRAAAKGAAKGSKQRTALDENAD